MAEFHEEQEYAELWRRFEALSGVDLPRPMPSLLHLRMEVAALELQGRGP